MSYLGASGGGSSQQGDVENIPPIKEGFNKAIFQSIIQGFQAVEKFDAAETKPSVGSFFSDLGKIITREGLSDSDRDYMVEGLLTLAETLQDEGRCIAALSVITSCKDRFSEPVMKRVLRIAQKHKTPKVRRAALEALVGSEIPPGVLFDIFLIAGASPFIEVRGQAISVLGRQPNLPRDIQIGLCKIAKNTDEDRDLRIAALGVFVSRRERDLAEPVLNALSDIVKTEQRTEIVRHAIHALRMCPSALLEIVEEEADDYEKSLAVLRALWDHALDADQIKRVFELGSRWGFTKVRVTAWNVLNNQEVKFPDSVVRAMSDYAKRISPVVEDSLISVLDKQDRNYGLPDEVLNDLVDVMKKTRKLPVILDILGILSRHDTPGSIAERAINDLMAQPRQDERIREELKDIHDKRVKSLESNMKSFIQASPLPQV